MERARPGAALLLTLLVVGLLSVSTISFMRLVHLEARVADNAYTFTQAEILARAGLKGAMAVLAMDDNKFDARTDPWGQFDRYAAMTGGFFEEGLFTGRIEDLSSLVNVNYLVNKNGQFVPERVKQMERLLGLLELDPALVPAILDWLDADDKSRMGGAENRYYLSLAQPYPCANSSLNTPGQLILIKGIGRQAFYGLEDRPGLGRVVTVWSNGKINVNTAGETVLMSLDDGLTKAAAQEIIQRRAEKPFEKLDELREISSLTPEVRGRIVGLASVTSSHFRILMEGRFRQARVLITAVVQRDNAGVRLIYYRAG